MEAHQEVGAGERPVPTPVRQDRPLSPEAPPANANAGLPAKPPVHLESWELNQDAQFPHTFESSPAPTMMDSTEKDRGGDKGDGSFPQTLPQESQEVVAPVPPLEVPKKQPSPESPTLVTSDTSDEDSEIPDIQDQTAPRFGLDEHHISPNAIKQRAKRMFTKRVDGSMKVSETIFNEWKGKGQARKNLEQIFKSVGYDPDPCVCFRYLRFIF